MKNIKISDMTLCRKDNSYSFKEKIEIARQLEKLNINTIELPQIENPKTDILLIKTIASFVKNSTISVDAGKSEESLKNATMAIQNANHSRLRIEIPLSTVGMEYICHKKAPKMGDYIMGLISEAKKNCDDVEFCAIDATRADINFVCDMINQAIKAGATSISIYDSAAEMMPDEFADFAEKIKKSINNENIDLCIFCNDKNGLASACGVLAVKKGVTAVKACAVGDGISLESFGCIVKNFGSNSKITSSINYTELNRIVGQIKWITGGTIAKTNSPVLSDEDENGIKLDCNDTVNDVINSVNQLGYDLSDEDYKKVYEEFRRVATKKKVGAKELEAIIASCAMQVPPEYTLVSYVINNGNIISASAQITLEKNGVPLYGICIGDGPVDAAFLAIEQIIGHHYELDDFQIQSVTEGKEAVGTALVKLRWNGKLYSGNGISTDIIGASIRAYINAVNKIVYEEA